MGRGYPSLSNPVFTQKLGSHAVIVYTFSELGIFICEKMS